MGKTTKWFRSLLSSKKSPPEATPAKDKKKSKWALSNSAENSAKFKNHEDPLASPYVDGLDANKHAIAVAAATAVVAEAALAAAQAAAEVVRLTSGGGSGRNAVVHISGDRRRVVAAIKIQSAFRAYLARRALRALKGLVKLQALVRGHIVRKQSSDMLRRMQAMARIQARASAHRSHVSESSNARHPGVENLRIYDQRHGGSIPKQYNPRSRINNSINKENSQLAFNWLDHWMEQCTWNNRHDSDTSRGTGHRDDEQRSDKILEIDTWKPRQNTVRNDRTSHPSPYFSAWNDIGQEYPRTGSLSRFSQKPNPSISSEEASSLRSSKFPPQGDQVAGWTVENSPRVQSSSSRPTINHRGPFTPTRSECSRSLFGDYLRHPNYMAKTESSRAKVRSQSAPKQRIQLEELGMSTNFRRGLWESDAKSEKGLALPANYRSNTYLNYGQLKRQGTPARGSAFGFSSMDGHRF